MTFSEALERLKEGLSVRREIWDDNVSVFIQFPDEHSKMTSPYFVTRRGSRMAPEELEIEELLADDWEVFDYKEEKKPSKASFEAMLKRLGGTNKVLVIGGTENAKELLEEIGKELKEHLGIEINV